MSYMLRGWSQCSFRSGLPTMVISRAAATSGPTPNTSKSPDASWTTRPMMCSVNTASSVSRRSQRRALIGARSHTLRADWYTSRDVTSISTRSSTPGCASPPDPRCPDASATRSQACASSSHLRHGAAKVATTACGSRGEICSTGFRSRRRHPMGSPSGRESGDLFPQSHSRGMIGA